MRLNNQLASGESIFFAVLHRCAAYRFKVNSLKYVSIATAVGTLFCVVVDVAYPTLAKAQMMETSEAHQPPKAILPREISPVKLGAPRKAIVTLDGPYGRWASATDRKRYRSIMLRWTPLSRRIWRMDALLEPDSTEGLTLSDIGEAKGQKYGEGRYINPPLGICHQDDDSRYVVVACYLWENERTIMQISETKEFIGERLVPWNYQLVLIDKDLAQKALDEAAEAEDSARIKEKQTRDRNLKNLSE